MSDYEIAYRCRYCGWDLTVQGLADNDGRPYCCRSAERGSSE